MAILFPCPCGNELEVSDDLAGRQVRCPECQRVVTAPDEQEQEAIRAGRAPRSTSPLQRGRPRDEEDEDRPVRPIRRVKEGSGGLSSGIILGIVLGAVLLLGCIIAVPILLLVPAVQKVREAAQQTQNVNNLKQIVLAMHNFNDTNGQLPPAIVYDASGRPLYSWRVLLLPYVEQQALYQQFRLDEPWDSPHNKPLLASMPKLYAPPGEAIQDPYLTFYQVFEGPTAPFESDPPSGLTRLRLPGLPSGLQQPSRTVRLPGSFPDGLSNTFLVVEASDGVPWTKPADLRFDPARPLPPLGRKGFSTFPAAFGDGSVRRIAKTIDEQTLRALITPAGGETIMAPP